MIPGKNATALKLNINCYLSNGQVAVTLFIEKEAGV